MVKIKIFVIAVVWLMSCFLSAQAQNKPCECADKEDLLNLLNVTQTGIQEYKFQLDLITAQEKAEGKTVMYSENGYKKLHETFENAVWAVRKKGLTGKTTMDTGDCSIKGIESEKFCVQQVLTILYRVHQKVCMETLLWRNGKKESYLEKMEMKQIALESIAALKKAQDFILQLLNSLPKTCCPNNWFGYVVYQKIKTQVINKTIPPKNTNYQRPGAGINIVEGGSGTQIYKTTYIGTIFVEEGKASSARGYAASSLDDRTTVTGRIYCSPKKPDESSVVSSGQKDFIEGESEGKSEFRLDVYPAKGKYHIYLRFFSINAIGETSSFRNISGGCGEKPTNYKNPITMRLEGPGYYGFDGIMKPDSPDYLEGSKIEKPPFGNQSSQQGNTSLTETEEIQVRWMLRRLPLK
jgi:hypothetical protein